MCRSRAIILFESPCPKSSRTSRSRAVRGSTSSSTAPPNTAGPCSSRSVSALGRTTRPRATTATAAPISSGGASGETTPQPRGASERSAGSERLSSESSSIACVPSSATDSATVRAVSSTDSSPTATTTTSASESSGPASTRDPASPTISTPSPISGPSSIERSPARANGAGATTKTRVVSPFTSSSAARPRPSRVSEFHLDLPYLATHHTQANDLSGTCERGAQRSGVLDRLTGHGEQHVPDQQTGPVGGAVRDHTRDHQPRVLPRRTLRMGQCDALHRYTQPWAPCESDVARGPSAIGVARDSEGQAAEDHGVHPDNLATSVDERPAGVSGREVGVGLDVARPAEGSPHSTQTTHYPGGHRPTPAPGVPDGEDQLPDAQGVRVANRRNRQALHRGVSGPEHREIQPPAAPHDLRAEGAVVRQSHLGLPTGAHDDVVVRHHGAVRGPEKTGTRPTTTSAARTSPAPHLHDAGEDALDQRRLSACRARPFKRVRRSQTHPAPP